MYSLEFDGFDLSIYGLTVNGRDLPFTQNTDVVQLEERAYAGKAKPSARYISVPVSVEAVDVATLISRKDSISNILNTREDAELKFDAIPDRYWEARLEKMSGRMISPTLWQGVLDFVCQKPFAYSATLVDNTYAVNADPKTITFNVGGSANSYPIYTLTAGGALPLAIIEVENNTTGWALVWSGSMLLGQELEIDCEYWTVKLDAVDDMNITGRFPYLIPGSNSIQVTGFGALGSLRIRFRARYM